MDVMLFIPAGREVIYDQPDHYTLAQVGDTVEIQSRDPAKTPGDYRRFVVIAREWRNKGNALVLHVQEG